jgi:hypothetical protein
MSPLIKILSTQMGVTDVLSLASETPLSMEEGIPIKGHSQIKDSECSLRGLACGMAGNMLGKLFGSLLTRSTMSPTIVPASSSLPAGRRCWNTQACTCMFDRTRGDFAVLSIKS